MPGTPILNDPSLVAVWPGMGHVALNAGVYLLSKLHMDVFAELEAADLFDVDHVEVRGGLIRPARAPRNRFFAWRDPEGRRDLVVFLGEAQPPIGGNPFCRHLVRYARQLGVSRVYTFAAMATGMRPEHRSRTFAAATDAETLGRLRGLDLDLLDDGRITGLNGLLLGVAADAGLPGACLLGEIPQVFAQFPFPKASLAVLEAFKALAGIEIDLAELDEQARTSEEHLGALLSRVEAAAEAATSDEDETDADDEGPEAFPPEAAEEPSLAPADERRIEGLFSQAETDRSKAFVLKRELDRLDVFGEYEDRFLDLFRKPD